MKIKIFKVGQIFFFIVLICVGYFAGLLINTPTKSQSKPRTTEPRTTESRPTKLGLTELSLAQFLSRYKKGHYAYYEISVQKHNCSDLVVANVPCYIPNKDKFYHKLYFKISVFDIIENIKIGKYENLTRVVLKIEPIQNTKAYMMDEFPLYAIDFSYFNNKMIMRSGYIRGRKDNVSANLPTRYNCFANILPWYDKMPNHTFTRYINDINIPRWAFLKQCTIFRYSYVLRKEQIELFKKLRQSFPWYIDNKTKKLASSLKYSEWDGGVEGIVATCKKGKPVLLEYTEMQWWKESGFLWERMVRYSNQGYILFKGRRLDVYPPKGDAIDMDYINFRNNEGILIK